MSYTGTEQVTLQVDNTDVKNLFLSGTTKFNVQLYVDQLMNQKFQSLNEEIVSLKQTISTLRGNTISAGTICAFAGPTIDVFTMSNFAPPDGYEWCLGQIVSKTDEKYTALYAAIGGYWNTSTELTDDQFQLPDLRNVFLRGCTDYVEGSSSTRQPGSFQGCGAPEIWAESEPKSRPSDTLQSYFRGALAERAFGVKGATAGDAVQGSVDGFDFKASRCSSVYQSGLTEVRPDNKAVNYIIKL